jgi:hypothetical protein
MSKKILQIPFKLPVIECKTCGNTFSIIVFWDDMFTSELKYDVNSRHASICPFCGTEYKRK